MKLLRIALYLAFPLLTACATVGGVEKPLPAEVQCNDFAKLGHSYYQYYGKDAASKPVAFGTVDYFETKGVISRLRLSGVKNALATQRQFALSEPEAGPELQIDRRFNQYVAVLIPPETAAKYLGQTLESRSLPAFLMVPTETFYKGQCRAGVAPFLIGASESLTQSTIPQLMIGEADLKALVAALYLDPRSGTDLGIQQHYAQKFVNPDTWGGWSEIKVKPRRRCVFRGAWNAVTGSSFGRYGKVEGTSLSIGAPYVAPPLEEIIAENKAIEGRWRALVASYKNQHEAIEAKVKAVQDMLASARVDGAAFLAASEAALSAIQAQRDVLDGTRVAMGYEQDMFVTSTEIDFVVGLLKARLEKLYDGYNETVARYTAAAAIKPGQPINSSLLLNPIPVDIDGVRHQPAKATIPVPMDKFGGNLSVNAAAFLEPVKQADNTTLYKVRINGLINLTNSLQEMRGQLARKIHAEQRCSLRIRFINFDIPDTIVAGKYEKPVDIGVTVRTCATVTWYRPCGKWYKPKLCKEKTTMKTNLYDTTARGLLGVQIDRIGDDFRLSYRYSVCAHGFFCARDNGATPRILESLQSNKKIAEVMKQVGAKAESLELAPDLNGGNYLALQITTKPLDAASAILALNAIRAGGQL